MFGTNRPSNAVGILTGTRVYRTTVEGSPTSVTRWGDYLSVRQNYDDAGQAIPSFAATGYALNQNGDTLPHYIEFAREQ
jgi:hypothetical protein